jgi:hypothetical protein
MNLPIVPHPSFALLPAQPAEEVVNNNQETKLRVLVQPNDVQVKRVGRASCIEPDVKLCVEMDTPYPKTIAVNAYLKVVGKDNKDKLILLRRSDDITFTKTHKREIIGMKLRFLKNIKVQVLKRNLGVSRPEASIVFEAVSKENEFEGACSTSHFAIISDPRYLDEVKHRRASERNEPLSDDEYHPVKRVKRRRIDKPVKLMAEEPTSPSFMLPRMEDAPSPSFSPSPFLSTPSPVLSPASPSSCTSSPFSSSPSSPMYTSSLPDALQALKECADYELITDSKEEQKTLMKLVEALKHKGCNFDILPPRSSRVA